MSHASAHRQRSTADVEPRVLTPARVVPVLVTLASIVAALLMLPFAARGGTFRPWAPVMVDLDVYQFIAHVVLSGGDILAAQAPGTGLAFIYPAFAALLSVPLVLIPHTALQVVWTAFNVAAYVLVLYRTGLRGWPLALIAIGSVLVVEPIRTTLSFGQINIFLMAMVLVDLLPSGRVLPGRRLLPVGVLTGLATALKVTPAVFIVYLLLTRQWRAARNAAVTAVVVTVATAFVLPDASFGFWKLVFTGDTRTGPAHFLMNQSVLGAILRVFGETPVTHLLGLALGAVAGVVGVLAAARWHRLGRPMLGLCLTGIASVLASPLSWTHHWVWIVPLGVTIAMRGTPGPIRWVGGELVGWSAVALFKYVLPWGSGVELSYTWAQVLMSDLVPIFAVGLVALALVLPVPAGTPSRPPSAGPPPADPPAAEPPADHGEAAPAIDPASRRSWRK